MEWEAVSDAHWFPVGWRRWILGSSMVDLLKQIHDIHRQKLAWNPNMKVGFRWFSVFKGMIFRFHVSSRGSEGMDDRLLGGIYPWDGSFILKQPAFLGVFFLNTPIAGLGGFSRCQMMICSPQWDHIVGKARLVTENSTRIPYSNSKSHWEWKLPPWNRHQEHLIWTPLHDQKIFTCSSLLDMAQRCSLQAFWFQGSSYFKTSNHYFIFPH